jgi:hypothetical protein
VLSAWLLVGGLLLGQAETPTAPAQAETVRGLVRELDAAEKAPRDAAERQLIELGPGVLALLPQATDRTPAEVRLRLDRIRAQLERAQADASARASTVMLRGEKLKLSDVLAAIAQQTGNKIIDFRPQFGEEAADVEIAVNFDKTPFWQALDQVLDQAGLTIYGHAGEEGLAVVSKPPTRLPRSRGADDVGAFRIEATDFTAHRDLRDPASHTLQLNLDAAWEPRLKPIVILQPADAAAATDEAGRAVNVAGTGNALEINVNSDAHSVELPIHFNLPERTVKRFAQLKGSFTALVPGHEESFRFENLEQAKKVEQRRAGVTVVLDDVWKNNRVWEVRMRVAFDKTSGALESHRNWIFNNEAWLETPDKEKIPYGGMETTRQTESEVGVAYLFSVPGGLAGHTFVYRTPVTIMNIPIHYELKDLELP